MLGILSLDIILLVVFLLVGIPLPFCFGGALVFMAFFGGTPIRSMMLWGFNQMISLTVLAGPIFILTGTLISESGIAKRLLALADLFAGRIRGMIGVIAVLTCGFLGAVSGSGFTGVAAVGPIMIPEMEKRGYSRGFATSLISAATILGLLI
ncbi:MAG: TRAP transporter large permease subunit, partial [Acetomicrobium sp.]